MILQGKSHSPVTLAGQSYITISNQTITAGFVNLQTDVTDVLPIASGGTSNTAFSASSIPYLDTGASFFTSDSNFIYDQTNSFFSNFFPVVGSQFDIGSTMRVLSFGNDLANAFIDGTPLGITFSGFADSGRLEFRTEGGNGYSVWSTTFMADNFVGGGASLTNLNASELGFGTVAIARGGTDQNAYTTNGIIYYDGTRFNSASTLQFNGGRVGIGGAASGTASRLLLLTGSSPEIQWVNSASSNKSWHVGLLGTAFIFTETGIAINLTLAAGGGMTLNVGSFGITAGNITLSNGLITQNTAVGANTFAGTITTPAITYTAAIRQMNVAAGVTIMEFNYLPLATALNSNRAFRFLRETNTGTGVGSILFNIGLNTSLEAFTFITKQSVIAQMSLSQSETGNWAGVHRIQSLAPVATPTVTPVGTTGATTYSYRVTAVTGSGETEVSAAGTTTTGNAALSASNYNRVTWARSNGCMVYKVYGRTSGAELLMATVTGGDVTAGTGGANYDGGSTFTFEDIGSITPSGAQNLLNTTGVLYLQNSSVQIAHVFRSNTGQESVLNEQGADIDLRIEGDTATSLLKVDAGLDAVQIGTTTAGVIADFRSSVIVFNEDGADRDFRMEGDTDANLLTSDASTESIAVGVALGSHVGKLHVDQSSTTAAKPVLTLDQADTSEEMIRMIGSSGSDVTTLVDGGIYAIQGNLRGYIKVYIQDDANNITDGVYYIPFYDTPQP